MDYVKHQQSKYTNLSSKSGSAKYLLNNSCGKHCAIKINFCPCTDISSHLEVARGCYRYGYYSECSELCKNIINEKTATQPEKNQAMLLLGKASFHLYRQMQFELEKEKRLQRHYTAPYRAKHKQCYEKAKVAIGKLGAAMDGNFLEKKEEELRMLDMAMIDYLQETNKLERCLLCRKHTKLLKSHYLLSVWLLL